MKKNIGVIGSGYWGKNLVRNFHELGYLRIVCDVDKDVLNVFKEKYGDILITTDFQSVLDDENVEGVVIATPAVLHYEMAKRALHNGKDVFVEKPLSLTVEEGEDLVKIAREKNQILMVGHILQYHPAGLKLLKLVEDGELGKLQYIYSNRLNFGKIRTEENILWSFAPHDISVILMLLKEMPNKISSHAGTYLTNNVADVTLTTMNFPSGVKSHIFVSWLHPYKEQKLVVVGSERMAVFNDVSNEKLMLYPHEIEWVDRVPIPLKKKPEIIETDTKEPLKEECKHFLECIEKRMTPRTDGREGLNVLKILQCSQESLENGGKSVSLDDNNYFVHESAIIDEPCQIGDNTKIWHFTHVMQNSKIGSNCTLGQNTMIAPGVTVGDKVKIQNNVSLYSGVCIEDNVFLGPSMVFTNIINPRSLISRKDKFIQTLVKEGATLGANATIICGNNIGKYALVGAGSVVTKDVPDYALFFGNPAKLKGWVCECGNKLEFHEKEAICACGRRYNKNDDIVVKIE